MNIDVTKNISLIYRAHQKYMTNALKDINIACSEYPLLLALSHNDGVGQNELSRIVKMNKSLASRSIKSLLSKDLIYINQHENCSNKNNLHLSPKGESILPKIIEQKRMWGNHALHDFTNDEKELFMNMLDKLLISATALQGD